MKIKFSAFIIILISILSCKSETSEKLSDFNSTFSTEQIEILDDCNQLLDNWYFDYSGGKTYSGQSIKPILKSFSKSNNISSLIGGHINCEQFDSLKNKLEKTGLINQLLIKDKNGLFYKANWESGTFLDMGLVAYAEINDTNLFKMISVRKEISLYSPSMVCEGYGSLKPEQLDNAIYKRILFIDLFLLEYYYHCRK